MDVLNSLERGNLALVEPTSSLQTLLPEVIPPHSVFPERASSSRCNRKDLVHRLPSQTFLSAKERHEKKARDTGHFPPQQVDRLSKIQDDDYPSGETGPPKGLLDSVYRPKRCILARPRPQSLPKVSGLRHRTPKIQIPRAPLRTKRGSSHLHQDLSCRIEATPPPRGLSLSLPGRLACLGPELQRMPGSSSDRLGPPKENGLSHQRRQITSDASTEVHMAGSPVAHEVSSTGSSPKIKKGRPPSRTSLRRKTCVFQEMPRESPGQASVCLSGGSRLQDASQGSQQVLDQICQEGSKGLKGKDSPIPGEVFQEMVSGSLPQKKSSLETTIPLARCPYRRVPIGMGLSLVRRELRVREVVTHVPAPPYKRARVGDSVYSHQRPPSPARESHPGSCRQYDDSTLYQQEGLIQVSSPQQLDPIPRPPAPPLQPLPDSLSRGRGLQRGGGCALPGSSDKLRVVPGSSLLSVDVHTGSVPTNRSLCHARKSSTPELCLTHSGSSSGGERRFSHELEQVVGNLSVSPIPHDFTGFGEVEQLPRNGIRRCSLLAESSLVSSNDVQVEISHEVPKSLPVSESRSERFLMLLQQNPPPSRVDFLKEAYAGEVSHQSAEVLVQSIRPSSRRQYQTAWTAFTSFVRVKKPSRISNEVVLSFMKFLFVEKKFSPATVITYKTALSKPLKWAFGIDVSTQIFSDFYRALQNLRPATRVAAPEWKLDEVLLRLCSQEFTKKPSLVKVTMKLLFLLTLATGGRISEINALRRGNSFIKFLTNGDVQVVPDPRFIAKNEDPSRRRAPIVISRLLEEDGKPHKLCPVESLKYYLLLTSDFAEGPLFLNPTSFKPCSVPKMRYLFKELIILSNPKARGRFHDVRKFGSSLAFFSGMSLVELCDRVGWLSVGTFRKHYCKNIGSLSTACVAIGVPHNSPIN